MTNRIATAVTLGAFFILAGCGYHFKGAGLEAPEGVETIAIPVLENQTAESGIESTFTGDLIYEFMRNKAVGVVQQSAADAVLEGRVRSLDVYTVAHTTRYDSDIQRVRVRLDLQLKTREGRILWAVQGLSDDEPFQVSDDRRVTEQNKREAVALISERLAEKVHSRILEDF
jgi:outer membrane lipopolysaccharide assembly protein LptE/RlpB